MGATMESSVAAEAAGGGFRLGLLLDATLLAFFTRCAAGVLPLPPRAATSAAAAVAAAVVRLRSFFWNSHCEHHLICGGQP